MKRALVISLICVMAMGAIAFAGPYIVVENEGLVVQPSLVVGWDFFAPFVDYTNMSISGDFYAENGNLAIYSPWKGGFDFGFAFCDKVAVDVVEFGLGMEIVLVPGPLLLEEALLQSWTTALSIDWYPSSVATIYAAMEFKYDMSAWMWNLTPVIGLEVYWP